ncbi:MAG: M28 family metallopeptidase [Terriglobales bacterium]|jgi:N-acetylated-alpha-linked acidic dipeptidase
MKSTALAAIVSLLTLTLAAAQNDTRPIFGFRNPGPERDREKQFLAVPDAKLAEQHLKALSAAPHVAGTPEDRQTAEYVAGRFRAAGLETEIVTYRVWMNYPAEISVDVVAPAGITMHGPTREHLEGGGKDPDRGDPRIVLPFSGDSPGGDMEGEVVYVNYGRPEDFQALKDHGIDVRGKILLARYGQNYRGVKVFLAQKYGAAGVLLYSDPIDDGWSKGDMYPKGPWRPDTAVQRGSIGYMFEFPGDPTTPGIASTADLSDALRTPPEQSAAMPRVPTTPLSYRDAQPILEHLAGATALRDWQGALPFTYHLGPGPVRVRMHLKQDYAYREIWNVIGKVRGSEAPDEWVIAGNHRDAWVYGAVDPGSGTAAMLESVHGIGELLKSGWRPQRTILFASWDGEEQGLVGSTEWAEQNAPSLANAVAYFNTDVAVSGPNFGASAVPSLKQFVRDVTESVPGAKGGTVYDDWRATSEKNAKEPSHSSQETTRRRPAMAAKAVVPVGDLGSGSDYVAFLEHLGVPSTDIGSSGPYGVYHSAFDSFNWFKKFADPDFVYEQQQARVMGLEILRMADADVLPYDYEAYGREIHAYLETAKKRADQRFATGTLRFGAALAAADRLISAGAAMKRMQTNSKHEAASLNQALLQAERAFLLPEGLPHRPWYKHSIYAPGEYTGYAAAILPGVTESVEEGNVTLAGEQLQMVTAAIECVARDLQTPGQRK